jgi:hypothetical protein
MAVAVEDPPYRYQIAAMIVDHDIGVDDLDTSIVAQ